MLAFPVNALSDYLFEDQRDAIFATHARIAEGHRRILGVACTGWGKTIFASNLAKALNAKTLFLAHRHELIGQAAAAFRREWPGVSVGRIDSETHDTTSTVTVAMVQSLVGRLDRTPTDYDLVIIDEAHRSTAATYQRILAHLTGADAALPGMASTGPVVVGITATPRRPGEPEAVYEFFNGCVAFFEPTAKAIERGRLCDFRVIEAAIDIDLDADELRNGANGDYAQGALGSALTSAGAPALVADAWMKAASDRLTMVFAPTVALAELIAEEFRSRGVNARHIEGGTPADERAELIARYKAGEIRVLSSVSTLTEGFDAPMTDCIVMARPTKSEIVFQQALGRGLRVHPGKSDCLLINLTGNTKAKSASTAESLLGLHIALSVGESAKDAMQRSEREAVERMEREVADSWEMGSVRMRPVDAVGRPRDCMYAWAHSPVDGCADRWVNTITSEGEPIDVVIKRDLATKTWVAGANLQSGPKLIERSPLIGDALKAAEAWATGVSAPSRKDDATDAQLAALRRLGVDTAPYARMTKGLAGALIGKAKAAEAEKRAAAVEREMGKAVKVVEQLARIEGETIMSKVGDRRMMQGTVAEVESLLGVTFLDREQAAARLASTMSVLVDRGVLRRQGSSFVVCRNERAAC